MGKIPESTSFKISDFIFRFRESSQRFVVEILTKNLAFNLSGTLFFIGLGCSLKWWYKDQLLITLLKQNLPAFSQPHQKISWETGEYLIGEQTRQFLRKKQKNNEIVMQSNLLCNLTNLRLVHKEGAHEKSCKGVGLKNSEMDLFLTPQVIKDKPGSFSDLIDRVDVYSNSVVINFVSPWQKHAYHRFVGLFPELICADTAHTSSMQVRRLPSNIGFSEASEDSFSAPNSLGEFKKATSSSSTKFVPSELKKKKYTFLCLFSTPPPKNWFKLSARGLCILNDAFPSSPTVPLLASSCVTQRGKEDAQHSNQYFGVQHESTLRLCIFDAITTLLRKPLIQTLEFPFNAVCEIPEKKMVVSAIESSNQRFDGKSQLVKVVGEKEDAFAEHDFTPLVVNKISPSQLAFSVHDRARTLLSIEKAKPSVQKTPLFCTLRTDPMHTHGTGTELIHSLILNKGLAELSVIVNSPTINTSIEENTSPISSKVANRKLGRQTTNFSYPLELTPKMNGWQPPVQKILLNSYLDEIPYKLENTLWATTRQIDNRRLGLSNRNGPLRQYSEDVKKKDQTLIKSTKKLEKGCRLAGTGSFIEDKLDSSGCSESKMHNLELRSPGCKEDAQQVVITCPEGAKAVPSNSQLDSFKSIKCNICSSAAQKEGAKNDLIELQKSCKEGKQIHSRRRFDQLIEIKQLLINELQILANSLPVIFVDRSSRSESNNQANNVKSHIRDAQKKCTWLTPNSNSLLDASLTHLQLPVGADEMSATRVSSVNQVHELDRHKEEKSTQKKASHEYTKGDPKGSPFASKEKEKKNFFDVLDIEESTKCISDAELLLSDSQTKGSASEMHLENSFSLLNSLGITFNNLSYLKDPPVLLPMNQDASFWKWNRKKVGISSSFFSLLGQYCQIEDLKEGVKKVLDPRYKEKTISATCKARQPYAHQKDSLRFFQIEDLTKFGLNSFAKQDNSNIVTDTTFCFDPNTMTWQVLQQLNCADTAHTSKKPLVQKTTRSAKQVRFINQIILKQKKSRFFAASLNLQEDAQSWSELELKERSGGGEFRRIETINPVDTQVSFTNKRVRLMSGYIYPDTPSASLMQNFYRWTYSAFPLGGTCNTSGETKPEVLSPITLARSTEKQVGVNSKGNEKAFAHLAGRKTGANAQLSFDANKGVASSQLVKKTNLFSIDGEHHHTPLIHDCLLYSKKFREINRFGDNACLFKVCTSGTPTTIGCLSWVHPCALHPGCKGSVTSSMLQKRECTSSAKTAASEALHLELRGREDAQPGCTIFSTKRQNDSELKANRVEQWSFDHHLGSFPGFIKPNQFLLSINQIAQGNNLSEDLMTHFYDVSLNSNTYTSSAKRRRYGVINSVEGVHEIKQNLTQNQKGASSQPFDCSPRKTAYNGIVVQRNPFTKDFQLSKKRLFACVHLSSPFLRNEGFAEGNKKMHSQSLLGTFLFGPENPFTDRQSHFFGQRRLSTVDINVFQRDYLRQLGRETLLQSNQKEFTYGASVERTKILSFSKAINSFISNKRRYTYLLEEKDQWHLLFQEQLRTALEDSRKYPPLTPEESKDRSPGRIKVSAPLMMARFPKKSNCHKVLAHYNELLDNGVPHGHGNLPSPIDMHLTVDACAPLHRTVYNAIFTETYSSQHNSALLLDQSSFATRLQCTGNNNFASFLGQQWSTQEPLNANSWLIISQWSFLVALLFWIEQTFLADIFPSLFALEQLLLGTTGMKSDDRTHVTRVSKGEIPKFKDIAGIDGLLGELAELVLFLRGHKKRLWNKKSSYGVLLTGPPGTGKTFLVRALANEAKVPVLILSAGVLTANKTNNSKPSWSIRHAFRRAKQLAPCILFIDEIDALGRSRGNIVTDINEIVASAPGGQNVQATPLSNSNFFEMKNSFQFHLPKATLASTSLQQHLWSATETQVHQIQGTKSLRELASQGKSISAYNQIDRYSLCADTSWLVNASPFGHKSPTFGSETKMPSIGDKPLSTGSYTHASNQPVQSMQTKGNIKRKFGPLTQLLVSMDGVSSLAGVLIIGATNRPESLDPALTRPGRFERIIRVEKPAEQKRIEILKLYSRNLGIQKQIPWSYLANRTMGLTAADLAVAMNYSSLKAIIQGTMHTIETIEYGLDSIARFSSREVQQKKSVIKKKPTENLVMVTSSSDSNSLPSLQSHSLFASFKSSDLRELESSCITSSCNNSEDVITQQSHVTHAPAGGPRVQVLQAKQALHQISLSAASETSLHQRCMHINTIKTNYDRFKAQWVYKGCIDAQLNQSICTNKCITHKEGTGEVVIASVLSNSQLASFKSSDLRELKRRCKGARQFTEGAKTDKRDSAHTPSPSLHFLSNSQSELNCKGVKVMQQTCKEGKQMHSRGCLGRTRTFGLLPSVTFAAHRPAIPLRVHSGEVSAIKQPTVNSISRSIVITRSCVSDAPPSPSTSDLFSLTKKSHKIEKKRLQRLTQIAYYQSGKIVVQTLLPLHPPVTLITLNLSGTTTATPADTYIPIDDELNTYWCSFLESRLMGLYGGKASSLLLNRQHLLSIFSEKKKSKDDISDALPSDKPYKDSHLPCCQIFFVTSPMLHMKESALSTTRFAIDPLGRSKREFTGGAKKHKYSCTEGARSGLELRSRSSLDAANRRRGNLFQSNIGTEEIQTATFLAVAMVNRWALSYSCTFASDCGGASDQPLRGKEDAQSDSLNFQNGENNKTGDNSNAPYYQLGWGDEALHRRCKEWVNKVGDYSKSKNRIHFTRVPSVSLCTKDANLMNNLFSTFGAQYKLNKQAQKTMVDKGSNCQPFYRYSYASLQNKPNDVTTCSASNQLLPEGCLCNIEDVTQKECKGCDVKSSILKKLQKEKMHNLDPSVQFYKNYLHSISNDSEERYHSSLENDKPLLFTRATYFKQQKKSQKKGTKASHEKLKRKKQKKTFESTFTLQEADCNISSYAQCTFFHVLHGASHQPLGYKGHLCSSAALKRQCTVGAETDLIAKVQSHLSSNLRFSGASEVTKMHLETLASAPTLALHSMRRKPIALLSPMRELGCIGGVLNLGQKVMRMSAKSTKFVSSVTTSLISRSDAKDCTYLNGVNSSLLYSPGRLSIENVAITIPLRTHVFQLVNPLQFSISQRDRFYPGWFRLYLPDIEATEFMKNVANYYYSQGLQTLTRSSSIFDRTGAVDTDNPIFGVDSFSKKNKIKKLHAQCTVHSAPSLQRCKDAKVQGAVSASLRQKIISDSKNRAPLDKSFRRKTCLNRNTPTLRHIFSVPHQKNCETTSSLGCIPSALQKLPFNYNDVFFLDKELIYHSLVNNCFSKAVFLIDQNRQLTDYFADYLVRFQILRQHQILYLFSTVLFNCQKQT